MTSSSDLWAFLSRSSFEAEDCSAMRIQRILDAFQTALDLMHQLIDECLEPVDLLREVKDPEKEVVVLPKAFANKGHSLFKVKVSRETPVLFRALFEAEDGELTLGEPITSDNDDEGEVTKDDNKKRGFSCSICEEEVFRNIDEFTRHFTSRHKKRRKSPTPVIKPKRPKPPIEVDIKRTPTTPKKRLNLKCHICDFSCRNRLDLESHARTEHPNSDTFKCDSCDFSTSEKKQLQSHVRYKHLLEFQCKLCEHRFAYKNHLEVHMATHSTENTEMCHLCGKGFKCRKYLRKHLRFTHAEQNAYLCGHCGRSFKHQSSYETHIKSKHAEQKLQQEPQLHQHVPDGPQRQQQHEDILPPLVMQ